MIRMLLEEKIKNTNLTKTERTIAEFILNHPEQSILMTSTDIAAVLAISDTSVIRFTRTLGYSGFNDFQKDMKNKFQDMYIKKEDIYTSPLEKLERNLPLLKDSAVLDQYFKQTVNNIKHTFEKNDISKFNNAANILVDSRKKYISGFRGCSGLSSWMAFILSHMLSDVIENNISGSIAFERMLDANENDVLVLFSLERYNKVGIDVMKLAKSNKLKIIVITDKVTASVAEGADILFIAPSENLSFFNSHVASMIITENILNSTSKLIGSSNEDRLQTIERYISPYGFY